MPIPDTPICIPDAYCQGGCRSKLRAEPVYSSKHKITSVQYSCDVCKYSYNASLQYLIGMTTKYEPPRPHPAAGGFSQPSWSPPVVPKPAPTTMTPQSVRADADTKEPESTAGLTGV